MTPEREAEELARLFDGRDVELLSFLAGQLGVLKGQAQIYLGIAGVCLSVTGFAGHNMVNAGPASAGCMIAGLACILAAIVVSLLALGRIRWVSQDIGGGARELALRVIARRDAQRSALLRAGVLIGVGLALYTVAVVLAALTRGGWTPP